MGELVLEDRTIAGPPLRGGKSRKKPYRPRPGRKKSPPDLIRSATVNLRFTPECRDFIRGAARAQGMDVSLFVYNASVHYAALARHREAPPPYDPKAAAAAPMLPGLDDRGDPGQGRSTFNEAGSGPIIEPPLPPPGSPAS